MTGDIHRSKRRPVFAGALLALTGLATVANAQARTVGPANGNIAAEAPAGGHGPETPPATDAVGGRVGVAELIVTGGKREERLRDVPASVFVATAAVMERAQVRDFEDLVRVVPSLTISKPSQPANNSINIRGIGTYAFSIATEPSVAVFVDDIPQAFQAAAFAALIDVAQVEVLRGPQNTLFGKAASAGVVNIRLRAITPVFTARTEAMVTDDHEYRVSGAVSGPISDSLGYRLAASFSDNRGALYNLATGRWVNGQSDTTLRGRLEWTVTPAWRVTLTPYYNHSVASCCQSAVSFLSPGVTFSRGSIPTAQVLRGIEAGPTNSRVRSDVNARGNAVNYGSGLRITRGFGAYQVTSISGFDRYDQNDLQDTDTTDFDFRALAPAAPKGGSANGGYFKVNAVTQELRLTSPPAGRLRYVAGLFLSRTGSARYFVRGSNTLGTYNGSPSLPSTNSTAYAAYYAHATDTNYAAFGQGAFALTDRLNLVAGLRFNNERIRYRFVDYVNNVSYGRPKCSTVTPTIPIATCNRDTAYSGRVGALYRMTPDVMAFATYSRGHKGMAYDLSSTLTTRTPVATGVRKGVPTADAVAANQPIPSERVDAFEVGLKANLFNDQITLNVTLFNETFHDFQAQSRDQLTAQNILNSVGRVTSRGVEAEAAAQLGASASVTLAAAYVDATIESFPNASCFPAQTAAEGCVGAQQNLAGKPLPNAPKWSVALSGQYDFLAMRNAVRPFVAASAQYQSAVIFSLLQDPRSTQPAYGLLNLSAGLQAPNWKLTLFVNNVTNEHYALSRNREVTVNIAPFGRPATDGIDWKPARDSFRYFGVRVSGSY